MYKKPHELKTVLFSALTTLLLGLWLIPGTAFAQSPDEIEWYEGYIKIKLTEEAKAALPLGRMLDNPQSTGISSVDMLSQQFNVVSLEPVFRTDPRFAERHAAYGLDRWYRLQFDSSENESLVVNAFRAQPEIESAERVYRRHLIGNILPTDEIMEILNFNDPRLGEQWHYNNTGQTGGTPGSDISLFQAWGEETGSSDVIIKVMDSGIDLNHPDLQGTFWENPVPGSENGYDGDIHGWNFVNNSSNIQDQNGHGTHVSGTIAARNNNGVGVAGIAGGDENGPGVQIMTARVFSGVNDTPGGFPEGFVYGADNGAAISNNSWGGGGFSQALNDAITYFIDNAGFDENGNPWGPVQGGLVFFAAGNNGSSNPSQPIASNPDVIAVASTNHMDQKAWYSQYGDWIDISAPGGETAFTNDPEGVLSTVVGGYQFYQGTSMASPHATGVAALIASKYPGITGDEIYQRMLFTVDDIESSLGQFQGQMGAGRINAFRALEDDDGVPPATITDLSTVGTPTENTITLTWTAPGSSGDEGQAFSYDFRYSTSPINDANFDDATPFEGIPNPAPAGDTQTVAVDNLDPLTTYYFAMKTRDLYANFSDLSNVVTATTDGSPGIAVSATQLFSEIALGLTEDKPLTITNTGEGVLSYIFPSYVTEGVLNSSNAASLLSRAEYTATQRDEAELTQRSIITRFENGELRNPTSWERAVVRAYQERLDTQVSNPVVNSSGVVIEFDGLTASGSEFFDVTGDGYTGELTAVNADFIIDAAGGGTWASDFALIFTTEDQVTSSSVVLQVGGFSTYGPSGTRIPWGTGDSGTPGTAVNTSIDIPTPLNVEDLYVWIGHGWTSGPSSTWSGTIEMVGVNDSPTFISAITPAAGEIPVGGEVEVLVTFDATGIVAGVYEGQTALRSNDLSNPSIPIEFFLQTEGGEVDLVASAEELDFGNVFRNDTATLSFSLLNDGTAIAQVEEITVSDDAFSISNSGNFNLSPGQSQIIEVEFTPDESAGYNETITIVSNNPDGDIVIALTGNGVETPEIAFNPESLEATLESGETETVEFQILNEGDGPLEFAFADFVMSRILAGDPDFAGYQSLFTRNALVEQTEEMTAQNRERNIINRYLEGREYLLEPGDKMIIDRYLAELESSDINRSAGIQSSDSFTIEFEAFTASGGEFMLVAEDLSGELTSVIADFVIDAASGGTWANDFGILFTDSEDISTETVVLQVGGLTEYGPSGTRLPWGTGGSGTPGTPVNTTIDIPTPLDVSGLYIHIGHAWTPGSTSTWSGSVELVGVSDLPAFITSVEPASGTVAAGESLTLSAVFDATGYNAGVYSSALVVTSNDQNNSPASLPVVMTVEGDAIITVDPTELDFGTVVVGEQ
ncbi:MAG: S8 family serine peptidase, partial [Balneolia bacterium]|nr:S8 family serine peptidase [Balneolia bacterium]